MVQEAAGHKSWSITDFQLPPPGSRFQVQNKGKLGFELWRSRESDLMFPATNWPIHSITSVRALDNFRPKICTLRRFNLCVSSAYEVFKRDAECMCVYSSVRDTRVHVHFTSPPITGRVLPLDHHPFLQTSVCWSHIKAAHRWIFLGIYRKQALATCTHTCL